MCEYVVAGRANCPNFARAEHLVEKLGAVLPHVSCDIVMKHPEEWEQFYIETKRILGFNAMNHNDSPLIWTVTGRYVGDADAFAAEIAHKYNIGITTDAQTIQKIADENMNKADRIVREKVIAHEEWLRTKFAPLTLKKIYPIFVGNQAVTLPTKVQLLNAHTHQPSTTVCVADEKSVELAIQKARRVASSMQTMPAVRRIAMMEEMCLQLLRAADDLAFAATTESGTPFLAAQAQVREAVEIFRITSSVLHDLSEEDRERWAAQELERKALSEAAAAATSEKGLAVPSLDGAAPGVTPPNGDAPTLVAPDAEGTPSPSTSSPPMPPAAPPATAEPETPVRPGSAGLLAVPGASDSPPPNEHEGPPPRTLSPDSAVVQEMSVDLHGNLVTTLRANLPAERRVTVGPVAVVLPDHCSLTLLASMIAPIIAAGCPFVVFPAPATPLVALSMGAVLAASPLPRRSFSVLPLGDEARGKALADPRFGTVITAGVAKAVADLQARVPNNVPVVSATAGAVVCVVGEDAAVEGAVDAILGALFTESGLGLTPLRRIFAHTSVYDTVRARLHASLAGAQGANPLEEGSLVGPMRGPGPAAVFNARVAELTSNKATVLVGGHKRYWWVEKDTALVQPTILEDLTDMSDLTKPVAGPLCVLARFTEPLKLAESLVSLKQDTLRVGIFTAAAPLGEGHLMARAVQRLVPATAAVALNGVPVLIFGDTPALAEYSRQQAHVENTRSLWNSLTRIEQIITAQPTIVIEGATPDTSMASLPGAVGGIVPAIHGPDGALGVERDPSRRVAFSETVHVRHMSPEPGGLSDNDDDR